MEHSRAAETIGLPVRTPQRELRLRRLEQELEPTNVDLFAVVGRDYPSAIGAGALESAPTEATSGDY
ncbi:hypothetical protein [Streptomyces sp. NPDC046685]|uniref:hypothetical protein n=1 Tax=Streptomyces sp. NPDC046685 TaxID=3157202 RepID=UPI003402EAD2